KRKRKLLRIAARSAQRDDRAYANSLIGAGIRRWSLIGVGRDRDCRWSAVHFAVVHDKLCNIRSGEICSEGGGHRGRAAERSAAARRHSDERPFVSQWVTV